MPDRLLIVAGVSFVAAAINFIRFITTGQRMYIIICNGALLLGGMLGLAVTYPGLYIPFMVAAVASAIGLAVAVGVLKAKQDVDPRRDTIASWLWSPVATGIFCIALAVTFMVRRGVLNGISVVFVVVGVSMILARVVGVGNCTGKKMGKSGTGTDS
jgi:phosphate/sulfate permease